MLYTPINHCVPRDQVSCRNFLKQLSWNIKPIFRLRIPTNHWITRNHILLLHWHTIKHLPSNFNKLTSKYNQITQFCKSTTNPNSIFFNSPWIYIPSLTKPTWEHVFKIKEKVNLSTQILRKLFQHIWVNALGFSADKFECTMRILSSFSPQCLSHQSQSETAFSGSILSFCCRRCHIRSCERSSRCRRVSMAPREPS